MGRPRRGESERISTIGASRTIPRLNPMHWEAARATFRSRSFIAVGRRLHRGGADCRLRLSQLGIGAISDHLLGPFDYMKGRTCQRGSFSGQTHDMVYRMGSANRLHRPTIPDGAEGRRRSPNRDSACQKPSFSCSGGHGEPSGGSVRPRGRPLRPPRAWTAPTTARTVYRCREGVNVKLVRGVGFNSLSPHVLSVGGPCESAPLPSNR